MEGVVGAAGHPADLVVDLGQIGQLKQEKRSTAQRSPHMRCLDHTFRWPDANIKVKHTLKLAVQDDKRLMHSLYQPQLVCVDGPKTR